MKNTNGSKGRPVVHTEPWSKITVVMLDRHTAALDRLAIDIRMEGGGAVSRAELIREMVDSTDMDKLKKRMLAAKAAK